MVDFNPSGEITANSSGCESGAELTHCQLFTPENWDQPQTVTINTTAAIQAGDFIAHSTSSSDPAYRSKRANSVSLGSGGWQLFLPAVRQ